MDHDAVRGLLTDRLRALEERLAAACHRSGRPRSAVTLVAVTKTVPTAAAAVLPELGLFHLGENRPQELWRKAAGLPSGVHWHLIGHLQRNKIERTLPLVHLIHSIDSARLLTALENEAGKQGRTVDALLEINLSREPNKTGLPAEDLPTLLPQLASLRHVRLCGLMTMAALEEDPQRYRPTFSGLRVLRDQLQHAVGTTHRLAHLSMGMSNDFEVAIEEGATLVRIGTALLEGVTA